jgi:hypothetical protein
MVVMAALQFHGGIGGQTDDAVHVSKYVGFIQCAVVPDLPLFEEFIQHDRFALNLFLGLVWCSHALFP